MKPRTRLIKGILVGLMVALMLSFSSQSLAPAQNFRPVPVAYADEPPPADQGGGTPAAAPATQQAPTSVKTQAEMVQEAEKMAAWVHTLFGPLVNFFSFQIGNFLGIDYIYSGAMGSMLHKIWVISRNITNIAFIFILLWMALKEIFKVKGESEITPSKMITFVLLLVAVNFSWLATKVVLDAANVVTNIVFAIPSGIDQPPAYGECQVNTSNPAEMTKGACFPTVIMAPADSGNLPPFYYKDTGDQCKAIQDAYATAYDADGKAVTLGSDKEEFKKYQGRTSICVENLNLFKYDMNSSVVYLTYGMARIQNLVYTMGGGGNAIKLAVGVLLSLILQVAFTISLLALFIALIIRMGMLWFLVAFSPFMVLVFWLEKQENQKLELGGNFSLDYHAFLNWAFVPAKVGMIFAVTFIMVSAGQTAGVINEKLISGDSSGTGIVLKILEWQSLLMGMGTLQNFIWLLMCIVVLWMGVFAILNKMPIIGTVTGKIDRYGKAVATKIGEAPYWAPVLPLGKGGSKVAVKELMKNLDIKSKLEEYSGSKYESNDIRKMESQIPGVKSLNDAYRQLELNNFSSATANKLAREYGFDNAAHMMTVDRETLKAALRSTNGNTAGKEDALLDALKRYSAKESPETKAQSAAADEAARIAERNRQNPPSTGGTGGTSTGGAGPAKQTPGGGR